MRTNSFGPADRVLSKYNRKEKREKETKKRDRKNAAAMRHGEKQGN